MVKRPDGHSRSVWQSDLITYGAHMQPDHTACDAKGYSDMRWSYTSGEQTGNIKLARTKQGCGMWGGTGKVVGGVSGIMYWFCHDRLTV